MEHTPPPLFTHASHKAHHPAHHKKRLHKHARPDYQKLFDTCVIDPKRVRAIDRDATKIIHNMDRYKKLVQSVEGSIPWWFVGLAHKMEADSSFKHHLHNGDPLTARTVQVPAGRPIANPQANPSQAPGPGNPYTWEESAQDALRYQGLTKVTDWSLANALYRLEGYNGYGYLYHGINSPYLWSFSNHYTKGHFVKDRVFDPNAVSHQAGSAVVLKRLVERGAVVLTV
jgi:lysozyme family protein